MFNFLSLKPKNNINNTDVCKYQYREYMKQVIEYLNRLGRYNPNDTDTALKTDPEIFDILDSNLDKNINWHSVGITLRPGGDIWRVRFFDNRNYFLIEDTWDLKSADEEIISKLVVLKNNSSPTFIELNLEARVLQIATVLYYPCNIESLDHAIDTLRDWHSGVVQALRE